LISTLLEESCPPIARTELHVIRAAAQHLSEVTVF